MAQKVIRDPVHDVISLQTDLPVDRLIFHLLACPEFQRLRRIRQLGMASLAYPGADHSRYSHSLGVMETARQIIDQLGRSFKIDEMDRAACLAAALLHDLGHGPFSHVFERVSGVDHELLTSRVILDPGTGINRTLCDFDPGLPTRVVNLLQAKPGRTYLSDILSSQLDADRLDYLLRDNLMTGSQYGNYDLRWMLQAMTIEPQSNRLAVTWKGVSAVEAYLQARYHMYRNVYFHKVVRAGEGMVKLALQRAKRMAVQDRLDWPRRDDPVYKTLLGQQLTMEEFSELDDIAVMHCFKVWSRSDDHTLASLSHGLLYRRLFKTIDLTRVIDPARLEAIVAKSESVINSAGGESAYAMFYDQPNDTPYKITSPQHAAASEIVVLEADGSVGSLADISPFIDGLVQQLTFRRIHVSEVWRGKVESAIAGLI
ncbi:MAG: HD domain-containing protein [Burkholderiales bacterium]|nr:HD domain-containing protein [Phycisphaerae bacterium]